MVNKQNGLSNGLNSHSATINHHNNHEHQPNFELVIFGSIVQDLVGFSNLHSMRINQILNKQLLKKSSPALKRGKVQRLRE
jgi:hypothetical protein